MHGIEEKFLAKFLLSGISNFQKMIKNLKFDNKHQLQINEKMELGWFLFA